MEGTSYCAAEGMLSGDWEWHSGIASNGSSAEVSTQCQSPCPSESTEYSRNGSRADCSNVPNMESIPHVRHVWGMHNSILCSATRHCQDGGAHSAQHGTWRSAGQHLKDANMASYPGCVHAPGNLSSYGAQWHGQWSPQDGTYTVLPDSLPPSCNNDYDPAGCGLEQPPRASSSCDDDACHQICPSTTSCDTVHPVAWAEGAGTSSAMSCDASAQYIKRWQASLPPAGPIELYPVSQGLVPSLSNDGDACQLYSVPYLHHAAAVVAVQQTTGHDSLPSGTDEYAAAMAILDDITAAGAWTAGVKGVEAGLSAIEPCSSTPAISHLQRSGYSLDDLMALAASGDPVSPRCFLY